LEQSSLTSLGKHWSSELASPKRKQGKRNRTPRRPSDGCKPKSYQQGSRVHQIYSSSHQSPRLPPTSGLQAFHSQPPFAMPLTSKEQQFKKIVLKEKNQAWFVLRSQSRKAFSPRPPVRRYIRD